MDSGEWRYRPSDDERSRPADPPAYERAWTDDATATTDAGEPGSSANLWADDPSNAWGVVPSWAADQSAPERPRAGGRHELPLSEPVSEAGGRVLAEPSPWLSPPQTPPTYPIVPEWGQGRHSAPSTHSPSAGGVPSAAPESPAMVRGPTGIGPESPAAHRLYPAQAAVEPWRAPAPSRRTRDERRRRDGFGHEPAYGQVVGYTTGWFGIPALFYLIWLVTLDGERQSLVWRQFVASLPWLFAAVVLAIAVAALLRWAIMGWRALTLSFASAVIGAGVITIAHSLTI